MSDEVCQWPMRSAMSTPSSTRLTQAIEEKKPDRNGRVEIEKIIQDGTKYFLPRIGGDEIVNIPRGAERSPPASMSASSRSVSTRRQGGRIALACSLSLRVAVVSMQKFDADMRFQEAQGANSPPWASASAGGRPGQAAFVDRGDENFHCIGCGPLFCRSPVQ